MGTNNKRGLDISVLGAELLTLEELQAKVKAMYLLAQKYKIPTGYLTDEQNEQDLLRLEVACGYNPNVIQCCDYDMQVMEEIEVK